MSFSTATGDFTQNHLVMSVMGMLRQQSACASQMETLSDNGLTVTFKVEGDSLSMTSPTGQSYVAKLDGTEAPYKGDPGTTSVSVKRVGKNTIEETDNRDGKIISVTRMTVAADGKTMTAKVEDKLRGTNSQFTATKQ